MRRLRGDVETKLHALPLGYVDRQARGDLLSRVHDHGEVISLEHTGEGTLLEARVNDVLAGELAAYTVA